MLFGVHTPMNIVWFLVWCTVNIARVAYALCSDSAHHRTGAADHGHDGRSCGLIYVLPCTSMCAYMSTCVYVRTFVL